VFATSCDLEREDVTVIDNLRQGLLSSESVGRGASIKFRCSADFRSTLYYGGTDEQNSGLQLLLTGAAVL
jgi:hypothetical protein